MVRVVAFLIVAFLMMSALTIVLGRIFNKNKLLKYIPSVILLILAMYNLYLARTVTTGFEDLARLLIAMILFAAFLGGLVSSLFIDLILPKFNKD